MRTRSGGVQAASAPAASGTRRELRRQAAGRRGEMDYSPRAAPPSTGRRSARSTKSSGVRSIGNGNTAPQFSTPIRSRRSSYKRALSPDASTRSRRSKRSCHSSGFYREDSDDEDFGGYIDDPLTSPMVHEERTASPQPRRNRAPRHRPLKQIPTRLTPSNSQLILTKAESEPAEKSTDDNVFIPDWISLPYLVWVQILSYASSDMDDPAEWLFSTSTVAHALTEAALTALYRSPPLGHHRARAHNLVSLLCRDPSTTTFNYRVKVRALIIDVYNVASKTHKGDLLDLEALVASLPKLESIKFHHWKDDFALFQMFDNLRWRYPEELFEALNRSGSKLSEWQWNRRMEDPDLGFARMQAIHTATAFLSLRSLSFLNYQLPSLYNTSARADEAELAQKDSAYIQSMADAISALPRLEHLGFEFSSALNGQLLTLLPKTLKSLEIIRCPEVETEDFTAFLLSHGRRLQKLVLKHNRSLSLAFITLLGSACQNLQVLDVDFKVFKERELGYPEVETTYENLLTIGQIPHWPESLEKISLINMKQWDVEVVEAFFQSLVDSAPKLLSLRSIDLKAMLDVSYQQRSDIRDRWTTTLKNIFLRVSENPLPFRSLREQPTDLDTIEGFKKASARIRKGAMAARDSPSRRSGRIAERYSNPSSRSSSVGRDLRNGRLGRPCYAELDTDDEGLFPDDGEAEEKEEDRVTRLSASKNGGEGGLLTPTTGDVPQLFYHGMCEKVEIKLDNGNPTAMQFSMDDFRDGGDDSEDEDWNGDDRELDTDLAW